MNDPRMLAILDPAIKRKMLEQISLTAAKLEQLTTLPREQLEQLASKFEIEQAFELSGADLQGQLSLKAEEFRDYRNQIEAIDDRVSGLGNLKAAARDAAERLDFDEVENVMARVDEVETEITAEAKEIRAANAFLRGRVQQAFDIYNAAADSFRSVYQLEPARRRNDYAALLYRHGLRYGGKGLGLAADMMRAALDDTNETEYPDLWAMTQNNLGTVLSEQANRLGGSEGAALSGGGDHRLSRGIAGLHRGNASGAVGQDAGKLGDAAGGNGWNGWDGCCQSLG